MGSSRSTMPQVPTLCLLTTPSMWNRHSLEKLGLKSFLSNPPAGWGIVQQVLTSFVCYHHSVLEVLKHLGKLKRKTCAKCDIRSKRDRFFSGSSRITESRINLEKVFSLLNSFVNSPWSPVTNSVCSATPVGARHKMYVFRRLWPTLRYEKPERRCDLRLQENKKSLMLMALVVFVISKFEVL